MSPPMGLKMILNWKLQICRPYRGWGDAVNRVMARAVNEWGRKFLKNVRVGLWSGIFLFRNRVARLKIVVSCLSHGMSGGGPPHSTTLRDDARRSFFNRLVVGAVRPPPSGLRSLWTLFPRPVAWVGGGGSRRWRWDARIENAKRKTTCTIEMKARMGLKFGGVAGESRGL
jgi:hypothetical protein